MNMVKRVIKTGVYNTNVKYGNERSGYTTVLTDSSGVVVVEWSLVSPLYVSVQKHDWVFSQTPLTSKPFNWSWGRSSEWEFVNPLVGVDTTFYGLPRSAIAEEMLLDEAEEARRYADEARRAAEAEARRLADELKKIKLPVEAEVACEYVTSAKPSVPSMLSAYFPISIRNAEWTCPGTGEVEKITGHAKVRVEGYEFDVPIRNGYGSPVDLGQSYEFRSILKLLGVVL